MTEKDRVYVNIGCPFCGNSSEGTKMAHKKYRNGADGWKVECKACGGSTGWYPDWEQAITSWNGRWEMACDMFVAYNKPYDGTVIDKGYTDIIDGHIIRGRGKF